MPYVISSLLDFLSFSNYSNYVLILFLCLCSVLYFCFPFCVFRVFVLFFLNCFVYCFFKLFCVLFLLLCSHFPICVQVYRPLPQGRNPIVVNKYHIISICFILILHRLHVIQNVRYARLYSDQGGVRCFPNTY